MAWDTSSRFKFSKGSSLSFKLRAKTLCSSYNERMVESRCVSLTCIPFSAEPSAQQAASLLPVLFPFHKFETFGIHHVWRFRKRCRGWAWGRRPDCICCSNSDLPDVDTAQTLQCWSPDSQPCQQHGKAWRQPGGQRAGGPPAVQAAEKVLLAILGGNFVVNRYLLSGREAATHPYPSSIPAARIENCFLKPNGRGNCILNSGEKLYLRCWHKPGRVTSAPFGVA